MDIGFKRIQQPLCPRATNVEERVNISLTFAGTNFRFYMQLRQTILFIPKGETEVVSVEIYTSDTISGVGLWNIDNNSVLLSYQLYAAFRTLKTQHEQKQFFQQLKKVSASLI